MLVRIAILIAAPAVLLTAWISAFTRGLYGAFRDARWECAIEREAMGRAWRAKTLSKDAR